MKYDTLLKNCPMSKNGSKKKKNSKRRHHAHTVEDYDPPKKKVKQESEDSTSDEEYVLISALMGTVTHGSKDWLIEVGLPNTLQDSRNILRNYLNIIHPIR